MCIIVYKPANVQFPSKKTLRECFENNPDGAGFMYAIDNAVYIEKGFMGFTSFNKALRKVRNKYGEDIPYVLHFRISTQAGINQECCHPYPLSSDMRDLRKLKLSSDIGIAHNGIISLTSTYSKTVDYNDTMKFITEYLSLIIKGRNFYKSKDTMTLIERLVESKLAILDGSGRCTLIGKFIEDNGVYYSNDTYQPYKYVSKLSSKWSMYDWDNYEDTGYYTKKAKDDEVIDEDEWVDMYNCAYETYANFDHCYLCKDKNSCYDWNYVMRHKEEFIAQ